MEKGDKITCIDGDFSNINSDRTIPREYLTIKIPEENKQYTVRELVQTELYISVRLEEIKNKEIYHDRGGWKEPAFSLRRFKKKMENKIDKNLFPPISEIK